MNRKVWLMLILTGAGASGLFCLNWGRAQDLTDERSRGTFRFDSPDNKPFWPPGSPEPLSPPVHVVDAAAAKLRDADSDEERATATEELAAVLDKYFEEDMKRREEEVARIEERVKKLRDLLEKRAAKKQEIIDLQIKVLENEAAGLGFFSQPGPPRGPKHFYNEPGSPWGYGPPPEAKTSVPAEPLVNGAPQAMFKRITPVGEPEPGPPPYQGDAPGPRYEGR